MSAWVTTGRRKTAHVLDTPTFALCGVMPPQWDSSWDPERQLRYDGRWHGAPEELKRCKRCSLLVGEDLSRASVWSGDYAGSSEVTDGR